jgi:hypothetical protein
LLFASKNYQLQETIFAILTYSAKLYENLRNMGAMFAFANLAVPPPRAMSHMDVSQGDHQGSSSGGGAGGLKAGGADQRPSFHRSDMFLERSPTLATVGSSGSGVSSRAGTIGGGGGNVRKQRLGQARSELRIIENHQHDNYATVSGASISDSSARADPAAIAGTTLVQLQDLGRSTSQRSSQRPSLQSMFSAHGSLLQLEPSSVATANSAVDSGSGGSSMHNLKQTLGGSFDDPSPYNTLKKRKVSQPSPLPPPPSKLAFNTAAVKLHQNSPASTDSPTGESRVSGGGPTGGLVENSHAVGGNSPAMSSSLPTATDSTRTAVTATSYDAASNASPGVPNRSNLVTISLHSSYV